ncbi:MAG TPA: hypothetical protein IGS40_26490 [Trichormus sp. M33_DOE_039]|nr:hypothetical protein [Trichormus sp. M33_DOE_039]
MPRPDLPLVLGMDGGYVRSYDKKPNLHLPSFKVFGMIDVKTPWLIFAHLPRKKIALLSRRPPKTV